MGKWGKGWFGIDPERTLSYFWGYNLGASFVKNRSRKSVRESAHGQTDRHTHRRKLVRVVWQVLTK